MTKVLFYFTIYLFQPSLKFLKMFYVFLKKELPVFILFKSKTKKIKFKSLTSKDNNLYKVFDFK